MTDATPNEDARAELTRYLNRFGDEGAGYFAEGLIYTEALEAHIITMTERVEMANRRCADAEDRLGSLDTGEMADEFPDDRTCEEPPKRGWNSLFRRGTPPGV